jgi:hypothetical protein
MSVWQEAVKMRPAIAEILRKAREDIANSPKAIRFTELAQAADRRRKRGKFNGCQMKDRP